MTLDRITSDPKAFQYILYDLSGNANGLIYTGRASGYGTGEQILKKRLASHHMHKAYPKADLIHTIPGKNHAFSFRYSDPAYWAIRGMEHARIKFHKSLNISANTRGGIGNSNTRGSLYEEGGRMILEALETLR